MNNKNANTWIVVDYLGNENSELSLYSEHLLSNIDASMALGEIQNVKTIKLTSQKNEENKEFCLDLDDPTPTREENKKSILQETLDAGGIVVCDRLNSMLVAENKEGETPTISHLYQDYLQEPDLIIFLDFEDSASLNEEDQLTREKILAMQIEHPEKIKIIKTDNYPHQDVCDRIWATSRILIKNKLNNDSAN